MTLLTEGLSRSPSFSNLLKSIEANRFPINVTGLGHIHKAAYVSAICEKTEKKAIVLTSEEAEASRLCEDLISLGIKARFYPSREFSLRAIEYGSREYEQQRLGVLAELMEGNCDCVVACIDAATQYTLPPETLQNHILRLEVGKPLPTNDIPGALVAAGYERCEQIEGAGQFAVRGGIVDIFPSGFENPIRIELWGDEIDTLSEFDVLSQRRTNELPNVTIAPCSEHLIDDAGALSEAIQKTADALKGKASAAKENLYLDAEKAALGILQQNDKYLKLLYPRLATLMDYLPDAFLFVSEMTSTKERMRAATWQVEQEIETELEENRLCQTLCEYMEDWAHLVRRMQQSKTIIMDTFARAERDVQIKELIAVSARQLPVWSGDMTVLCEDLADYRNRKMAVVILAGTEEKNAQVLAEDLTEKKIAAMYVPSTSTLSKQHITVMRGGLSAGAEFPDADMVIITHGRPTTRKTKRRHSSAKRGMDIHSLSELQVGDYIVHSMHGIGVYQGVHQLKVQGVVKDYLKLQYAKGDVLYVPVTQLDLVSKYIGSSEDATVHLHRLGGQEWQNTKTRVKTAVKDIAEGLIKLYSTRMASEGYAFSEDVDWQYDFERHFEYEETEDQLRCAEEIKQDMQRPIPMDRLLCGDVGFGKTEVALRAAFKCVTEGKQCAILVPTTILAFQHFQTVTKRFEGFPVKIEMLSRFRTAKQQSETIKRLARGEVDIIIGTHRLLSKDIVFKDLGLFIVDEEQRFGVTQKERLKEMTPHVDVLTLSATPIPRTLNMALSGIRDMSVLEEAPQDRHPVQTYVLEQDNGILSDAIRRELRRGGQVYYLHNRVDNIELVAAGIQRRIPEARVGFAHGKMSEEELSEIWRKVMEQEIDILVCTTIIETGVDVANVNTLIIEDADHFGLSQLHQLRGRVGRSSRRAYAYLTFTRGKALSEISTKRLEAMREFTEFGAGFRIAMRDMELRGAGNLLGAQQHGHMESVGYDLYLRLLGEAVAEQKGEMPQKREEECLIDLPIDAHIPNDYIKESSARLAIYRRIADIRTMEDSLDVYDELIDRFGEPPEAVQGLVEIALLRNMAANMGIYEVHYQGQNVLLYPRTLDMELGKILTKALYGRVLISAGAKPYFSIKCAPGCTPLDTLREALESLKQEPENEGKEG